MTNVAWWHDFDYKNGVMHVKKTGANVPVNGAVVQDTATWLVYYACIEAHRLTHKNDGPKVWFTPDRPRPWYLIWAVAQYAGLRMARSPDDADLTFVFEDTTHSDSLRLPPLPTLNGQCLDASKSRVGEVFEQVFGRALKIDPQTFPEPFVEKSELNGAHDGQIHHHPVSPQAGRSYQRLIDNLAPDGCVEDLRCPTIGGDIPLVFLKRRPKDQRFANLNTQVRLLRPDDVFTPEELAQLKTFTQAMQLDWGGMDVLRDRQTGEIWIVDVNKTDMGPPIALPLKDKLSATKILSAQLRRYLDQCLGRPSAQ